MLSDSTSAHYYGRPCVVYRDSFFFRTPCSLITARNLNKPCHMFGSVPDLKLVVQTLELGSLPPKRGDKNIYFRVVVLRHRDLNLKCKYLRNESSYIGLHKRKDFFSTAKGHLHPAKFVVWPTIGWVVDGWLTWCMALRGGHDIATAPRCYV